MATAWDAIVVGAGASGCVLARTLADAGHRVLLLEAGPLQSPNTRLSADSLAGAMPDHPWTWRYPAQLTNGRDHTVVRGRVLGGSMAVNGAYFRRARALDLERWAARAQDSRWLPSAVASYWRELEHDHEFGARPGHGDSGPIAVTRASVNHPIAAMMIAAGLEAGLPLDLDQNSDEPPGVGPTPTNAVSGQRFDTASAFLADAPSNLEVSANCHVAALHWASNDSRRVDGVVINDGTRRRVVHADRIFLSAGALGSAQLLQVSGIGPRVWLADAGVEMRVELPVGVGFSDHPNVTLDFSLPAGFASGEVSPSIGVSAHGCSGVGAVPRDGDLEVLSFHQPLDRMLGIYAQSSVFSVMCSALVSAGRGTLQIRSADPLEPPQLHFNYREDPEERDRLQAAARLGARMLVAARAAEPGITFANWSEASFESDRAADQWIDDHLSTALHSCGTTPMGAPDDPAAVVDGAGRVHGVDGLVVGDVGILPDTPTGGPAATAVFIGRVIAKAHR